MSTVVKDLGAVSAYAYAVEKGYTGTEAEFAELMADYAEVGQRAEDAADSALESKTAAQTAATTATNKASEATTAAQTATTKAGEASTSANTATSAKDTAVSASQTATTKATEATTAAATATSAKTDAVAANTAAQSAKTAAQTAQTGAETAAASVQASASQIAQNTSDISELKEDLTALAPKEDAYKAFPTDTASGAIASFSDGADNLPLKSLVVDINPVQDLSQGDPSPENICPISGWTEVNVNHSDADMTNPTTLTIQLGQTVYGGKLDVLSGVLTVNMAMVDLGTLSWTYNSSYTHKIFYSDYLRNNNLVFITTASIVTAVCSKYTQLVGNVNAAMLGNNATDKMFCIASSGSLGRLAVSDDSYTDKDAFKSAMNGVMLCYEVANPTTIQLTPHEVTALLGSNNVWADSGDSEVVYRADPTLYIQRLTEPDADMIADSNITSGQYFMVGNTLYKATANIASGATISPNVNCTRKSLSEALNELNA